MNFWVGVSTKHDECCHVVLSCCNVNCIYIYPVNSNLQRDRILTPWFLPCRFMICAYNGNRCQLHWIPLYTFESRHITCLYVYNIRKLNNYASRNSNPSKDSPQLEIVFYTNENCIIGHLQLDFSSTNLDSMGFYSFPDLWHFSW